MVAFPHNSVPQSADRGDDGDDYWHPDAPFPPPGPVNNSVEADSPTVLMLIVFFLRALLGIVQSGFVALAAAPRFILRPTPSAGSIAGAPENPPFPCHYATPRHLGERWYVIYVGSRVGVFNEWSDVAAATSGIPGNSHRRFGTQAEAEASFRNALARRSVRWVPVQPNRLEEPAANPHQGNTGANFATFGDPPDLKPRTKKEEPDNDE
ncbi:hypothetical protein BD410DRAFT_842930 [Rickenella mellea]|uniref:Ribonuclease H1 N-terminal domain-containing protein n=1 Tax=Rickenella mellea TaxID=50990 RepID=A0A4Y7PUP3_9AGAM|nr:hypothetical protein BD410DRAFT_842930 [Rickenella mellea]